MKTIKCTNYLKPKKVDDIVTSELEPELILLNLATGFYFSLDEVGIKVYEMCNGKNCVKDIIINISKMYKKDFKEIEKDIIDLINEMVNEKILEYKNV